MAALKIALLGAIHPIVSTLAAGLNSAIKKAGWQAMVTVAANPAALPVGLVSVDLVLLMGLESTTSSDVAFPPAEALKMRQQEAADQSIRAALADAGVPYQVLYGSADERLAHALGAIESLLPRTDTGALQGTTPSAIGKSRPWVWMCEKCSDPQCEHQLFSALLTERLNSAAAAGPAG
ncbi:MAG: hypothetical protein JWP96_1238 [Polaromonas sp.]|nr:hypothetical protein [Polaromonas sp.]